MVIGPEDSRLLGWDHVGLKTAADRSSTPAVGYRGEHRRTSSGEGHCGRAMSGFI